MGTLIEQLVSDARARMKKYAADGQVGENLPGAENDKSVPEKKKESDTLATKEPSTPAPNKDNTVGAVIAGDEKTVNEVKLEVDEKVDNPEKSPMESNDAAAKTASAEKLANDLLASIFDKVNSKTAKAADKTDKVGDKTAKAADKTDKVGDKTAKAAAQPVVKNQIHLSPDVMDKIASSGISSEDIKKLASAMYVMAEGKKAAQNTMKNNTLKDNIVSYVQQKRAEAKDRADFEAGVRCAMELAKKAQDEATTAVAPAAPAEAPIDIPADTTPEELIGALVDSVDEGAIAPEDAQAIASSMLEGAQVPNEEQIAGAIADAVASGQITPEEAQEVISEIEGGGESASESAESNSATDAATDAAAEAAGEAAATEAAQDAADEMAGEQAAQDAADELAGAAVAQEALKQAAARAKVNAGTQKSASASPLTDKVNSILLKKASAGMPDDHAMFARGFAKKAAELGIDPKALAQYAVANS